MPCFKGVAVSIHAIGNPLPEYGMQKQSRLSRISTYIPVPQPRLGPDSNKPEPARFAISITLLTPELPIPYSTPKPTDANPSPEPQYVGPLPSPAAAAAASAATSAAAAGGPAGAAASAIPGGPGFVAPYIPMTASDNETIAAYIYFDGRAKEEVATLLRPGEETWVNSRWVQIPEAEGGGLAEREFLFREVGLEKWLNGLDLKGHGAAEKIERRRQKFERLRRRQENGTAMETDSAGGAGSGGGVDANQDAVRYCADDSSPLEAVANPTESDSPSDDDEPPEATGQIKVAMFRVLASGEIKKGEYSPQFDAHDDEEEDPSGGGGAAGRARSSLDADVEHTTSFAKPRSLDPKTISTQTVTGIDPPDKPYATFTFFYRGERQLQKIGFLASSKQPTAGQQPQEQQQPQQQQPPQPQLPTPTSAKRRSGQLDFSSLGPLKTTGTVGFSAFRDQREEQTRRRKARKKGNGGLDMIANDDSDDDDDDDDGGANGEILAKMEDIEEDTISSGLLAPEDAKFSRELADGVGRIRLKRAHSAEPESAPGVPGIGLVGAGPVRPARANDGPAIPDANDSITQVPQLSAFSVDVPAQGLIGSPLKKQKPFFGALADEDHKMAVSGALSASAQLQRTLDATPTTSTTTTPTTTTASATSSDMIEEEL